MKNDKRIVLTICWNSQLRMMDVALFGRTPRFDADDDETIADCFRRFVHNESSKVDDESGTCDEPLDIICDKGV